MVRGNVPLVMAAAPSRALSATAKANKGRIALVVQDVGAGMRPTGREARRNSGG